MIPSVISPFPPYNILVVHNFYASGLEGKSGDVWCIKQLD